jgi:hypothetical protein
MQFLRMFRFIVRMVVFLALAIVVCGMAPKGARDIIRSTTRHALRELTVVLEPWIRPVYEAVRRRIEPILADIARDLPPDSPVLHSDTHTGPLGVPPSRELPPDPAKHTALVVTVDGQDICAELSGEARQESTVGRLVEASPAFANCRVWDFHWSGIIREAEHAVDPLARVLERAVQAAGPVGLPVVTVSHSAGAIIALRSIDRAYLASSDIDLLITIGAPVAAQGELRRAWADHALAALANRGRPPAVRRFRNYWTLNDRTSGPISGAENTCLGSLPGLDHLASGYVPRLPPLSELLAR